MDPWSFFKWGILANGKILFHSSSSNSKFILGWEMARLGKILPPPHLWIRILLNQYRWSNSEIFGYQPLWLVAAGLSKHNSICISTIPLKFFQWGSPIIKTVTILSSEWEIEHFAKLVNANKISTNWKCSNTSHTQIYTNHLSHSFFFFLSTLWANVDTFNNIRELPGCCWWGFGASSRCTGSCLTWCVCHNCRGHILHGDWGPQTQICTQDVLTSYPKVSTSLPATLSFVWKLLEVIW